MFVQYWVVCVAALTAAAAGVWLGYRLKSSDAGLGPWYREIVVIVFVAAAQAALLFAVHRLLGWTHWLQYLVAAAFAVIGFKISHLNDMDEYSPFVVAAAQLAAFWVALAPLGFLFGNLSRRFPMFP